MPRAVRGWAHDSRDEEHALLKVLRELPVGHRVLPLYAGERDKSERVSDRVRVRDRLRKGGRAGGREKRGGGSGL